MTKLFRYMWIGLLLTLTGLSCSGAPASFLTWLRETNYNKVTDKNDLFSTTFTTPNSLTIQCSENGLHIFVFGSTIQDGKRSARLSCFDLNNNNRVDIFLLAISEDAEFMPRIEMDSANHEVLHFLLSGTKLQGVISHIRLELDQGFRLVKVETLEAQPDDQANYGLKELTGPGTGLTGQTGLLESAQPLRIVWGNEPTDLLFSNLGGVPKVYVFAGDKYLDKQELSLMPLHGTFIVNKGHSYYIKSLYWVDFENTGELSLSKNKLAGETVCMEFDEIYEASFTKSRWLLASGKRGDSRVVYFCNLGRILNEAVKKFNSKAKVIWAN